MLFPFYKIIHSAAVRTQSERKRWKERERSLSTILKRLIMRYNLFLHQIPQAGKRTPPFHTQHFENRTSLKSHHLFSLISIIKEFTHMLNHTNAPVKRSASTHTANIIWSYIFHVVGTGRKKIHKHPDLEYVNTLPYRDVLISCVRLTGFANQTSVAGKANTNVSQGRFSRIDLQSNRITISRNQDEMITLKNATTGDINLIMLGLLFRN